MNFTVQPNYKEIIAEYLATFQRYDSYRKQFEQKAIDNYKLFIGYKEEKAEGKSNLHIPRSYEILDTLRARLVKSFFGNRPYVDFVPQPEGGDPSTLTISEQKAEVASANVDMQLEKNKIVKKFYDYITSMLIFPAGVMGVGWRYEQTYMKKKVPRPNIVQTAFGPQVYGWGYEVIQDWETTWDDNELVNIDFFDFWPDPRGTDIDNCRGVFNREWLTYAELESKMQLLQELGEGQVFPLNLEELKGQYAGLEEGRWERLSSVGITTEDMGIYTQSDNPQMKKNVPFELLHYWEDDRLAIIVNRTGLLYEGPNPYWRHSKKPFITASYDPLPNQFYGLSAMDILHDLQHELNTEHNQRIDNASFVLNKMWKVVTGSDVDESELVSRANGIIHVNNPDDVTEVQMGDIKASAFNNETVTSSTMENAVGAPDIVRGATGPRSQTATEAMQKTTSAGIRFDVKIALFEELGIKRLSMLMDMNNQQFISDRRLVKLGPEESVQWRTVEPGELIGEFDYRPAGTAIDPAANKEIRREQLTQMMQFLMSTGIPYVDMYELVKTWLESFDVRNAQKFLIPREVIEQRQMMQQAAMGGMLPQPQMGGGGPPVTPQPQKQMPNMVRR